ncbi:excinuclease ABC subunit UvrC [Helicobacter turcicus]|uniref:UvrABC system protein C n=1 Tax=Helicobacter turcicus TaxID=2867412 RepID=A0ABS7JKU6_9HELI|nr:excinuclease ABC subunit UvrC [Helicobacter turcicus]MBX7490018.1 excinuclease ABC subunit UvrC [Helicobacter turcicus]MBX7544877.1 excinuclease ABC subunit UvrC [Helicobacter turcicus]
MTESNIKPLSSSLLETLKKIPSKSGVYHYFDAQGRLLYVGKAKNLKNRIKSYFRFTPSLSPAPNLSPRIMQMVSQIAQLRYIVVQNENDALILENSLIKQLKPKYNILLRDDKTYPYLCVDLQEDFPRILLTRKVLKKQGLRYFGPFSSGARDFLDSIYEIFPLVQKEVCKKGKKACLFYQINRCLAPCEGRISTKEYAKILQNALECLENPKKILAPLEKKMLQLSQNLRFEEAKILRDKIIKIKNLSPLSSTDFANLVDLDVFAFVHEEKRAVLVKFFIRNGKIISSATQNLKSELGFDIPSIYKQALINYYSNSLPLVPKQILLPFDLGENTQELESFLRKKIGKKIAIHFPKSGDKKRLCDLAIQNGKELLRLEHNDEEEIFSALRVLFDLQNIPHRFEVFDTSHHKGTQCVGAMVVYDSKEFIKESYRHYLLEGRDEYSQMREMLKRRIEDFKMESPPDLWVLDGGAGQINLAKELLDSAGVNLEVIGISKEKVDNKAYRAKGGAKDILRDENLEEYHLGASDKRLQFVQKLRDEAHRFAITFHQKQKQKTMQRSKILEIKGVGKAAQNKLLAYFGSFEAIENASLQELEKVLSKNLALSVFKALN